MDRRRLRGRERTVLNRPGSLLAALALAACTPTATRATAVDVGGPRASATDVAPTSVDVALRALPALAPWTLAENAELDALVTRLRDAKAAEQGASTDEIARRFGGRGLARALRGSVPTSPPETRWFRTEQLLARLDELADPGAADDLAAYVATTDDVHFRGRAAVALAKLGDLRAADALARRLRAAPAEVYAPERFWESGPGGHLSRTEQPRIEAARVLVDLARLYPERHGELAKVAADAITAWAEDAPAPHAHALRFLARVRAPEGRAKLEAWAMPEAPLPAPGAQPPFPVAFEIAQSALRALGLTGDAAVLADLERQLLRKEEDLDISMEALSSQPIVMRGMTLRALAFGAAQGMSELGDARAVPALDRVIRDPRHNEEARVEACEALAWCTEGAALAQLGADLPLRATSADPIEVFRTECLLSALARRAPAEASPRWIPFLGETASPAITKGSAALLAVAGSGSADATIAASLDGESTRPIAAAILVLGGTPRSVKAAAAAGASDPRAEQTLHDLLHVIGGATDGHLQRGTLLGWARRFREASEPKWMREPLERFFEATELDRGPHSLTRVVLRRRMLELAVFGSAAEREDAKTVLALMKERGALHYVARLGR